MIKNDLLDEKTEITILEDLAKKKKTQIHNILPEWVVNRTDVHCSIKDTKSFSKCHSISKEISKALKLQKIKKFFPVQYTTIPLIIDSWSTANIFRPHDICITAPTGSGKTLAYVVPILQLLYQFQRKDEEPKGPRAIIILPVRDLAAQVYSVVISLSGAVSVQCALLCGRNNLQQERIDANNADVIVCTPGRLLEHIRSNNDSRSESALSMLALRFLVIDEADRVLQECKHDWFAYIKRQLELAGASSRRDLHSCFIQPGNLRIQKILLSATLTHQLHILEHFDLHHPKLFVFGSPTIPGNIQSNWPVASTNDNTKETFAAPEGLQEYFVMYGKEYCRILFIVDQIRRQKMSHILCFTNTKETATRLNRLLNEFSNIRSAHLHCEQAPDVRQKLRKKLEMGDIEILITVDSMGRGIDIVGVKCVIQYDLQIDVATYIHRVGRTARAGQSGYAYALASPNQIYHLKKNLLECGRAIRNYKFCNAKCYPYMNEYNAALKRLQNSDINEGVENHMDYDL